MAVGSFIKEIGNNAQNLINSFEYCLNYPYYSALFLSSVKKEIESCVKVLDYYWSHSEYEAELNWEECCAGTVKILGSQGNKSLILFTNTNNLSILRGTGYNHIYYGTINPTERKLLDPMLTDYEYDIERRKERAKDGLLFKLFQI